MRIALFSDIHGNLAALRAVAVALAREQAVDHVVVAGDHLQGGPRPAEVWEMLTSRGWNLIRGNEDDALLQVEAAVERYPASYRQAALAQCTWTCQRIGPEILTQLAALPESWRASTPAGDILVVHASPRSLDDRVGGAHNSLKEMREAYSGAHASAIAFGHFHRSFVRPTPFALLINVASVGLPLDNRPLANYTVVTGDADGWIVEQHQVPYDPSEEATIAEARGMPLWVPSPTPSEA